MYSSRSFVPAQHNVEQRRCGSCLEHRRSLALNRALRPPERNKCQMRFSMPSRLRPSHSMARDAVFVKCFAKTVKIRPLILVVLPSANLECILRCIQVRKKSKSFRTLKTTLTRWRNTRPTLRKMLLATRHLSKRTKSPTVVAVKGNPLPFSQLLRTLGPVRRTSVVPVFKLPKMLRQWLQRLLAQNLTAWMLSHS